MSLTAAQQIQQFITQSRHILVAPRPNGGDALGASLGLYLFLKHKGAQADIAADVLRVPNTFNFLPFITDIKTELPPLQKFIIKVDIAQTKLESLSYDIKDNILSIFLTPKIGSINREQITTASTSMKYDLIITVDAPDLDSLGRIFSNNTDLFYKTPIINIDHHPNNERYGQVNAVDMSASSTSEIMVRVLEGLNPHAINQECATALLTGMIANTKSFKTTNVTPATLQTASRLMQLGANRDAIVERLYRSKSLTTLKLWGVALNKLHYDQELGLLWCALGAEEFVQTQTTPECLTDIIDEILINAPEARMILLLYQDPRSQGDFHAYLRVPGGSADARIIAKQFNPQGSSHSVSCTVPAANLLDAVSIFKKSIMELPPNALL